MLFCFFSVLFLRFIIRILLTLWYNKYKRSKTMRSTPIENHFENKGQRTSASCKFPSTHFTTLITKCHCYEN